MKRSTILLLLASAAALPAAALAQGKAAAEAPAQAEVAGQSVDMLTTKWTLKQPRKKAAAQTASVAGPAVPAPRVVKYPKAKQHKSRQRLPNNRTNASKTIAAVIRK